MKTSSSERLINYLGWAACAVLFAMLALPLWEWVSTHGWRLTLAVPAIAAVTVWLLRRPLWLLVLWLGLRG